MYNIIDLFFSCACIFNRSSLASLLTMPCGGEGERARGMSLRSGGMCASRELQQKKCVSRVSLISQWKEEGSGGRGR